MKHNTSTKHQRTKRIIKGVVGGLLLLNMAIASPAAAAEVKVQVSTATATVVVVSPGVTIQVSWGGCGGNCGQ